MSYSPPSVFIADDDEDDQFLLRLSFTQHMPACRLHFSKDGKEFLADLAREIVLPALLLLDLNMPFMGGLEVLEILRNDSRYNNIPIVVLTTSNDPGDKQQALALGATSFITKPINSQALGTIVVQLCTDWLGGQGCQ